MSVSMVGTRAVGRFRLLGWTFLLSVVGLGGGIVLICVELTSAVLALVWVGVPLTWWTLLGLRSFVDWHRTQLARLAGVEAIGRPYLPARGSWLGRLRAVGRDPATWRDLAWLLVNSTIGATLCLFSFVLFAAGLWYVLQPAIWALAPGVFNSQYGLFTIHDQGTSFLAIPLGAVALVLWWWWTKGLVRADARLARWLLAPTERSRLAGRVQQLAASRAETLDIQAVELRRIERDLHDGAQARLVGLGMSLGLAEELFDTDPAEGRRLLAEARDAVGVALADLRDLVRGIHPPVLADRGLDGAIHALVLAVPIPVAVAIDLPAGRLPPPVESAAYFAIAETLANMVKHSGASTGYVRVRHRQGRLSMVVEDNGNGGADPDQGTGLRGIERRLSAFDGTLDVSSPAGGPTVVNMEVPCEP